MVLTSILLMISLLSDGLLFLNSRLKLSANWSIGCLSFIVKPRFYNTKILIKAVERDAVAYFLFSVSNQHIYVLLMKYLRVQLQIF